MRLGLVHGSSGKSFTVNMEMVLEAERLGYDSVWTSESYGSDAISPAAWILARTTKIKVGTGIIQMGARAPAMAAMTAMTLQAMSGSARPLRVVRGGRFRISSMRSAGTGRDSSP